jgi:hypothetical protein
MPDVVLDYHRLKTPIDHPDLSVTRGKLEYPTVDVKFAYLIAIGKTTIARDDDADCIFTVDSFTDKAMSNLQQVGAVSGDPRGIMIARRTSAPNFYRSNMYAPFSTADFKIQKYYGGAWTDLATQAVDLTAEVQYTVTFSISGSTLKAWRQKIRDLTATPTLSATDTAIASGQWGGRNEMFFAELLSPLSMLQTPIKIIEVEVAGIGTSEDPYTPKILHDFTQGGKDFNAITLGAFEFSEKSATNIIVIYEDNPYKVGAIQKQIDYVKSKNLGVFTPPKDYNDAVSLYNRLRGNFKHWIAGKDNFAYQVLGWEILDWFQNVDFYYGELIEHKTHYQQLKQVPDFEIRNRLNELEKKISAITVLTEERDKHLNKIREIFKKGW